MGTLCGYVAVPPSHPWHGVPYDNIDVSTHGGLTYSDSCDDDGPICHVPSPGESDEVWWVGFDCGHCYDVMPAQPRLSSSILAMGGRIETSPT